MKAGIFFVALFALALVTIPMIAVNFDREDVSDGPAATVPYHPSASVAPPVLPPELLAQNEAAAPMENADEEADDVLAEITDDAEEEPDIDLEPAAAISVGDVEAFRILDISTGIVNEVPVRDYVRGAVAAEMPITFHPEALKAQAVAAHTYALYNHYEQLENPDPSFMGADFSADPSNMKGYITEQTAKDFYGEEHADEYWAAICEAADSVLPDLLVYEGEPIIAAYHAISSGVTEDAGNVWVGSADYLVPANSDGDVEAPNYETEETFSVEQVRDMLMEAYPGIELSANPSEWFGEIERSPSGYAVSVEVGDMSVHGKEIREIFGLRSHNIDISSSDEEFTFFVYGYGHGVGLSQYGADYLAREGYTYDEILKHYYTGAQIV